LAGQVLGLIFFIHSFAAKLLSGESATTLATDRDGCRVVATLRFREVVTLCFQFGNEREPSRSHALLLTQTYCQREKEFRMQKYLYTLPIALLFAVGTASAQMGKDTDKRPMQSPGKSSSAKDAAPITTAQGVAGAKDDQKVQLRGKITGQQGKDEYLLSDKTGNVAVEIPNRLLNGKKLANGTEVEVQGEVDTRRGKSPKVEAKSVTVVAASGGSDSSPAGSPAPGGSAPSKERSGTSGPAESPSRQPSPSPSPTR
jgi:uncharacterized protein (TIGR00156 family)